MFKHTEMPWFDKRIKLKLAIGPSTPIFHIGNSITFDGLVKGGKELEYAWGLKDGRTDQDEASYRAAHSAS